MREILFRGKSIDDGKWKYSMSLARHATEDGIITSYYIGSGYDIVKAETVGQYTGLTDIIGRKIFEGDIVKHYNNSDDRFDIGVLYWDETSSQWKRTSIGNFHHRSFTYVMSRSCEYEIIGNIHDNKLEDFENGC